jgi:hypothetical protein
VVNVPVELIEILENAVEEVYQTQGGAVQKRIRPRFSYQVHG